MSLTRRRFLELSGVSGATALLAGCASIGDLAGERDAPALWPAANDPAWRVLSRLTFGPRPDERARAAEIGLAGWIEEQLAPDQITDLDADLRVRRFDTLSMDASVIFGVREKNVRRELQQAALLRAIYSRRQLYEIMVDFWSDHFNISTMKDPCAWLKPIDDRTVIRPHALGQFRDLLWASLHSPAMLMYLDNQENLAGSPNENYARELLELHTLGVDAGYTQQDVREVARCLTGWTVDEGLFRGQCRFVAERHDDGPKQVLGVAIPAGLGAGDVERVFELLLAHPALPGFIARKLARRLVADEPPPTVVAAAAAAFMRSGGDIKAVLRAILSSAEFAAAPPKLKRPLHYIAGALRQLDTETGGGPPLLDFLARMGQPLFQWPTPDGFPDHTAAWSGSLLVRWQFALALARNEIDGTRINLRALTRAAGARAGPDLADRLGALLLGAPLPPVARDSVLAAAQDDQALLLAAIVASPTYQWH